MPKPFRYQLLGLSILIGLCVFFIGMDPLILARYDAAPFEDRSRWFYFIKAIKDWQTLLTGVLAVVTAGFAATVVMRQIRQAQELEDLRYSRRYRAAKAMMPEAMSRICAYAEDSYSALKSQWFVENAVGINDTNNPVPNAPVLNTDMFDDIKVVIENVSNDTEAEAYIELLSEIQVHQSRWSGRLQDIADPTSVTPAITFEQEMVEAAELYARASHLIGVTRPNPRPEDLEPGTRADAVRRLDLDPPERVLPQAHRLDARSPIPVVQTAPLPAPANH